MEVNENPTMDIYREKEENAEIIHKDADGFIQGPGTTIVEKTLLELDKYLKSNLIS